MIIHDNTATIYPHNNLLTYNKTYYVQIDPGVLTVATEHSPASRQRLDLHDKRAAPAADSARLVVSGDGSGDFNTVKAHWIYSRQHQHCRARVTIFIRNGTYEEIVYFRNKSNVTFLARIARKLS